MIFVPVDIAVPWVLYLGDDTTPFGVIIAGFCIFLSLCDEP